MSKDKRGVEQRPATELLQEMEAELAAQGKAPEPEPQVDVKPITKRSKAKRSGGRK